MKTSLELFTGAGGLALATHHVGFRHAGLFEWNKDACRTLRENARSRALKGISRWDQIVTEGDVSLIDFSRFEGIDLIAGGPPCQPFSLGGRHGGMEDKRDMLPQFVRAVRESKPRAFVMENVRGLTRPAFSTYFNYTILQLTYPDLERRHGEVWEDHLSRLQQHHTAGPNSEGLQYNVIYRVLNAADFGVPQTRERIFIVGFRQDFAASWSFPIPTHSKDALFYEQWISGEYWSLRNLAMPEPSATVKSRIRTWNSARETAEKLPWVTIRDAISDLPEPFHGADVVDGVSNHKFQGGARPYPGHTGSPIDAPSKTLKAGGNGVPGGENMIAFPDGTYRYFTLREAARIQTFPDEWTFEGTWSEAMRQLGNAVPVRLAEKVAQGVHSILRT